MYDSELQFFFVSSANLATDDGLYEGDNDSVTVDISNVEDSVQNVIVFLLNKFQQALHEKGNMVVLQGAV